MPHMMENFRLTCCKRFNNLDRICKVHEAHAMTIYSGPVFQMARDQFHVIADHLEIPLDERERLLLPKRAITVSCPIHMDDGRTAVFQGYRVQHHLDAWPGQGGTRFAPNVDIGEVAALAIWMSWKCALAELPYGGGKAASLWIRTLCRCESSRTSPVATCRNDTVRRARVDVMAPDMGTNEQVMAWFMTPIPCIRASPCRRSSPASPSARAARWDGAKRPAMASPFSLSAPWKDLGSPRLDRRRSCRVSATSARMPQWAWRSEACALSGLSDHTIAYYDPKA